MKAEPAKTEPAKTEQLKKAEPKPAEQQVQAGGKRFGLQCGAFKNRAQAESLQGRLAMAGVNAQIATSEEWNAYEWDHLVVEMPQQQHKIKQNQWRVA